MARRLLFPSSTPVGCLSVPRSFTTLATWPCTLRTPILSSIAHLEPGTACALQAGTSQSTTNADTSELPVQNRTRWSPQTRCFPRPFLWLMQHCVPEMKALLSARTTSTASSALLYRRIITTIGIANKYITTSSSSLSTQFCAHRGAWAACACASRALEHPYYHKFPPQSSCFGTAATHSNRSHHCSSHSRSLRKCPKSDDRAGPSTLSRG